jgi:hypothetical protein
LSKHSCGYIKPWIGNEKLQLGMCVILARLPYSFSTTGKYTRKDSPPIKA